MAGRSTEFRTDANREAVLSALREHGAWATAAAAIGCHRETLRRWREADPDFRAACATARDAHRVRLIADHTAAIKAATAAGQHGQALRALEWRLRTLYPDTHGDRIEVEDARAGGMGAGHAAAAEPGALDAAAAVALYRSKLEAGDE